MTTTAAVEHQCHIESDHQSRALVIRLAGALDWATAPQLVDYLHRHGHDRVVVIDLSAVTHSDSAGVGGLLVLAAEAGEQGHQLVVVVPDPSLGEALGAAGLGLVVPVVSTLREGWDALDIR